MQDFITKGGRTTAFFLRGYLLVDIALALVCSSRPSSAVKMKSTVMFYATANLQYNKTYLLKYTNLSFETIRAEINNFRSPQSCTILRSKIFREMLISCNRMKKKTTTKRGVAKEHVSNENKK